MDEIEKRTIGKVMWRLMPFLIVCYFVAYLDRVNVGFAKLQMNAALGLSEAAFGFGAGLFFIAYFLLEVPSNLALDKFGARLWIARIMLSWGIISGLFAFIGPISAVTGISNESDILHPAIPARHRRGGLLPGHHLLSDACGSRRSIAPASSRFSCWRSRSRPSSAHLSPGLCSTSPAPGSMAGSGCSSSKRCRRILMAIGVVFYLTDRPAHATWLHGDERAWLEARLEAERQQEGGGRASEHRQGAQAIRASWPALSSISA